MSDNFFLGNDGELIENGTSLDINENHLQKPKRGLKRSFSRRWLILLFILVLVFTLIYGIMLLQIIQSQYAPAPELPQLVQYFQQVRQPIPVNAAVDHILPPQVGRFERGKIFGEKEPYYLNADYYTPGVRQAFNVYLTYGQDAVKRFNKQLTEDETYLCTRGNAHWSNHIETVMRYRTVSCVSSVAATYKVSWVNDQWVIQVVADNFRGNDPTFLFEFLEAFPY